MKKIILLIGVIIIFLISNKTTEDLIIPSDSIRIRVVANSNSPYDQLIKKIVRNNVELEITSLLEKATTVEEARSIIKESIYDIEKKVNDVLETNNYNLDIDVNYGYNKFPEKKYKGVIYEEGFYESLVITLGEGMGDNWWCVLFPPLCLMENDEQDIEKIEYKSFIKEIIDKYF